MAWAPSAISERSNAAPQGLILGALTSEIATKISTATACFSLIASPKATI